MEVEEKKASIFVVGAKVALYVGRRNDTPYAVTHIAKVYKNGNVTIEHAQYSKRQFAPCTNNGN